MSLSFAIKGRLLYSILSFLFLSMLLVSWQWVFRKTLDKDYISLCLEFGPTVLIFNALIMAIWDGFNAEKELISPNPLVFLASWSFVAAGISLSFANAARIPYFVIEKNRLSEWQSMIEIVLSLLVYLVVFVVLLAWLLFAVPFLYFVFLVSASPVRQSLRSKDAGPLTKYSELVLEKEETKKTNYFSFNDKPVASAFALGSLLIWVIKWSAATYIGV